MQNKPYRLVLKHGMAEALKQLIEHILTTIPPDEAEDKMHQAVLVEINEKLYDRLGHLQNEYTIQLRPAQALALHLLYTTYDIGSASIYLQNGLMQISDAVDKQYSQSFQKQLV